MLHSMSDTAIRFELGQLSNTSKQREEKRKEVYERKKAVKESLSKGHKLCTACNQELSLDNFNVDKKTFTGYSTWCKSCKKDYNKKYLRGSTTIKGYSNDQAIGE